MMHQFTIVIVCWPKVAASGLPASVGRLALARVSLSDALMRTIPDCCGGAV